MSYKHQLYIELKSKLRFRKDSVKDRKMQTIFWSSITVAVLITSIIFSMYYLYGFCVLWITLAYLSFKQYLKEKAKYEELFERFVIVHDEIYPKKALRRKRKQKLQRLI